MTSLFNAISWLYCIFDISTEKVNFNKRYLNWTLRYFEWKASDIPGFFFTSLPSYFRLIFCFLNVKWFFFNFSTFFELKHFIKFNSSISYYCYYLKEHFSRYLNIYSPWQRCLARAQQVSRRERIRHKFTRVCSPLGLVHTHKNMQMRNRIFLRAYRYPMSTQYWGSKESITAASAWKSKWEMLVTARYSRCRTQRWISRNPLCALCTSPPDIKSPGRRNQKFKRGVREERPTSSCFWKKKPLFEISMGAFS